MSKTHRHILATMLLLASFGLAGCDPYNLFTDLTRGGDVCERAATTIADCCRDAQQATRYPGACRPFAGGLDAGLNLLVARCEAGGGDFIGEGENLRAHHIGGLSCDEALEQLERLWQDDEDGDDTPDGEKPDGDTPPDGDPDTDGDLPPDGDGECVDGRPCDDGDPCTVDDYCDDGECLGYLLDCSHLDTICANGICEDGACVAEAIEDETPCGDVDPQCGQMVCRSGSCMRELLPDDTACEDGDPCTLGDVCVEGACTSGEQMDCSSESDLCNDGICMEGFCVARAKEEGTLCDTGNPCALDEHCSQGICQPEQLLECDSLTDACNTGVCTPGGCVRQPLANNTACDDGDPCTVGDRCMGGICAPLGPKDCSAFDGPCAEGECEPLTGNCQAAAFPDDTDCSDGDPCTLGDRCVSGTCTPLGPKDCSGLDDACNSGVCVAGDCQPQPKADNTDCSDGDPCTVGDRCVSGTCTPTGPKDCSGLNDDCNSGVCVAGDCQPQPKTDNTICSDGDPCTLGDRCLGGVCTPTGPKDCSGLDDDCNNGVCVAGNCQPQPKTDGVSCDDQNPCTLVTYCQAGACTGVSQSKVCNDGLSCTSDTCNPQSGDCVFTVQAGFCLIGGVCRTDGQANPSQPFCAVCSHAANPHGWTSRNEGLDCSTNLCHLDDTCQNGVCVFTPRVCPDSPTHPCWLPTCSPSTGACGFDTFGRQGQSCDPGNACITGATCNVGDCVGQPRSCSHLDTDCQVGVCYPAVSPDPCVAEALDGNTCDDGDPQTVNDACDAQGSCAGEDLPLSSDLSGYLALRVTVSGTQPAAPFCARMRVSSPDPEGLTVSLSSPSGTLLLLHDRQPASDLLELEQEGDLGSESRQGDWVFELNLDDPSQTATVLELDLSFAPCPP